jgi:uncharacterized membrane protein
METLKKIIAAIGKFLHYAYFAQILIIVLGTIQILAGHTFWGFVIIALGVVSAFFEYNENKTKV